MSAAMAPVESNNHCTFRSAKDDFHAKEDTHIFPSLVPYWILLVFLCSVISTSGIVPGIGHCNRWDEDLCITLVLQGSRITTPGVKHKDITMTLQNLRGNSHIHSFYLQAPNVSRCAVTFAPCSVFNFPSRGGWLFPAQTTHLPQIVEKFSLSDQFRRHCPNIMRKVSRARSSNHPL